MMRKPYRLEGARQPMVATSFFQFKVLGASSSYPGEWRSAMRERQTRPFERAKE
jgi:hypothetical protein